MNKQILTSQQIIEFLDNRPSYDKVREMKNILEEYLHDIDNACEDWIELLPTCPNGKEWGDRIRRDKFRTIVIFLIRQGFIIGDPKPWNQEDDSGALVWELTDTEKVVGKLHFRCRSCHFFVAGCPIPLDDEGSQIALPSGLDWI